MLFRQQAAVKICLPNWAGMGGPPQICGGFFLLSVCACFIFYPTDSTLLRVWYFTYVFFISQKWIPCLSIPVSPNAMDGAIHQYLHR